MHKNNFEAPPPFNLNFFGDCFSEQIVKIYARATKEQLIHITSNKHIYVNSPSKKCLFTCFKFNF